MQILVVEDDPADPVANVDHPPRRRGGDVCRGDRFHVHAGAVEHAEPLVDELPALERAIAGLRDIAQNKSVPVCEPLPP